MVQKDAESCCDVLVAEPEEGFLDRKMLMFQLLELFWTMVTDRISTSLPPSNPFPKPGMVFSVIACPSILVRRHWLQMLQIEKTAADVCVLHDITPKRRGHDDLFSLFNSEAL
ncbi:hypothetical protein NC653_022217 [Populus alba x Populus x berolinensis]|uniref:Uncharacterized protein n=1 Tax=Populus alba x Populus x berolinensis TaxID=444605 RepID=A0AAD6ME99_9ROSI|nr:hypothetical protein NC653_022217 [Populus alba x Populus x berolinensis]